MVAWGKISAMVRKELFEAAQRFRCDVESFRHFAFALQLEDVGRMRVLGEQLGDSRPIDGPAIVDEWR